MGGFDSVERGVRGGLARVSGGVRRVTWELARSAYWFTYAAATAFLIVLLGLFAGIVDPGVRSSLPFAVESVGLLVDAAIGAAALFAAASVTSWVCKALARLLEPDE